MFQLYFSDTRCMQITWHIHKSTNFSNFCVCIFNAHIHCSVRLLPFFGKRKPSCIHLFGCIALLSWSLICSFSCCLICPEEYIRYEYDATYYIPSLFMLSSIMTSYGNVWYFSGILLTAFGFTFIFIKCINCTDKTPDYVQFIYYGAFVIIFQIGWASVQISHLSLIPELTSCENQKTGLIGWRLAMTSS